MAVDWDGTLVEDAWPKMGDWRPGAIAFVADMLDSGVEVTVFTARLNASYPDGMPKPYEFVDQERTEIRRMLDEQGFAAVDIFRGEKPNADVFIDDRAIWCPPSPRAWAPMVVKVFARLGIVDPL